MAANPQYLESRFDEFDRSRSATLLASALPYTLPTSVASSSLLYPDQLTSRLGAQNLLKESLKQTFEHQSRINAELLALMRTRWQRPSAFTELPAPDFMAKTAGIAALISRIFSFTSLRDGWDGYHGKPPPHSAVDDAAGLIELLRRRALPLHPAVDSSGDISLFQRNPYVEIGVPGNGTYNFFGIDTKGKRRYGDDLPISKVQEDKDLLDFLPSV